MDAVHYLKTAWIRSSGQHYITSTECQCSLISLLFLMLFWFCWIYPGCSKPVYIHQLSSTLCDSCQFQWTMAIEYWPPTQNPSCHTSSLTEFEFGTSPFPFPITMEELSIPVLWSTRLFLWQYHTVSVTIALWKSLKSANWVFCASFSGLLWLFGSLCVCTGVISCKL